VWKAKSGRAPHSLLTFRTTPKIETVNYKNNIIKNNWRRLKPGIYRRLNDFKNIWVNGTDDDIFAELVFCLFTPQSKAKSCWASVNILLDKKLLLKGTKSEIAAELNRVRFRNNKAGYTVLARKQFTRNGKISIKPLISDFKDVFEAREWLVKNIKGLGYKEASHFLRNIGFGDKITILDRHILKNLKYCGVIKQIPATITKSIYLEIEKKMIDYSKKIKIPLSHLDLLFWCNETGEIFK
jgi:N-glycosylase/DNA lyase